MKKNIAQTDFSISLIFSIVIHSIFLTLFYIPMFNHECEMSKETKISFLGENSIVVNDQIDADNNEELFNDFSTNKDDALDSKRNKNENEDVKNSFSNLNVEDKIKEEEFSLPIEQKDDSYVQSKITSQRQILSLYYPVYPDWAKKMCLESEVKVKFKIGKDGEVEDILFERMSGYPELDILALHAVRKWKFQPAFDDIPKEEWGSASLKFSVE